METTHISQRTREAIKQERREEVKTFVLCLTGCILAVLAIWVALVVAFSLWGQHVTT